MGLAFRIKDLVFRVWVVATLKVGPLSARVQVGGFRGLNVVLRT